MERRVRRLTIILLFAIHLLLIFCQGIWSTIDGYWSYHFHEIPRVPAILSPIKQNRYSSPYYILSGINTGYGFFGIKTSTEKYFRVTLFDSLENVIKSDRYFGLATSNGISRLGSYASYMANYIADSGDMIEKMIDDDADFIVDTSSVIGFRKEYVTKSLKWLGKVQAMKIPHCMSYKVELMTVVPPDIKEGRPTTKPELYVIQEGLFRNE